MQLNGITLKAKLRHFPKTVARILTSLCAKVTSFFFLACIVTFRLLSALQPSERTSTTENLFRHVDNFNQFIEVHKTFFGNETDVSIVSSGTADYSKQTVQIPKHLINASISRLLTVMKNQLVGWCPYYSGQNRKT